MIFVADKLSKEQKNRKESKRQHGLGELIVNAFHAILDRCKLPHGHFSKSIPEGKTLKWLTDDYTAKQIVHKLGKNIIQSVSYYSLKRFKLLPREAGIRSER